MKTCPVCHNNYPDDAMMFCLADGARLLAETTAVDPHATWHLPPPGSTPGRPVTDPGPTVASPTASAEAPLPTVAYRPEPLPLGQPLAALAYVSAERSRHSALPWVFAIVLVVAGAGVLIAWLVTRGPGEATQTRSQTATPAPATSPTPSPEATPKSSGPEGSLASATPPAAPSATPRANASGTPSRQQGGGGGGGTEITVMRPPIAPPRDPAPSGPRFGRLMDNATFTGTNLTYYPRTSAALCQADCAKNAACRGYTWIKPGAYNPGDSAMCYLIKVVGSKVAHPCCMSALKVSGG